MSNFSKIATLYYRFNLFLVTSIFFKAALTKNVSQQRTNDVSIATQFKIAIGDNSTLWAIGGG